MCHVCVVCVYACVNKFVCVCGGGVVCVWGGLKLTLRQGTVSVVLFAMVAASIEVVCAEAVFVAMICGSDSARRRKGTRHWLQCATVKVDGGSCGQYFC